MDTYKAIVIAALVAVVSLAGFYLFGPVKTVVEKPVGALAGPDIPSNYLQWGGLRVWQYTDDMAVASTTCSIVSPASTSTLLFAAAQVDVSSIGATLQYEWGKSASAFATTTSLGLGSLTSAAQGTVLASTTQAITTTLVDPAIVFAPSTRLNLKIGSSTPTTQSGYCYAQFAELL